MTEKKRVIIGGISGGIGCELAQQLNDAGYHVTGFCRNPDGSNGFETHQCDATDPEAVSKTVQTLSEKMGGLDAYVHAIGSIFLKPAHLTSDEDWKKVLDVNLNSAFYALRAVAKTMSRENGGSILFFSTAAARTGIANHEAIAAAKGGIEALVRSAAATYANKHIRVNAVAPSLTDTPLSQPIVGNEKALEISKRMHPLGIIGQAKDVASLAAWLISDQAKFVTGQIFTMDGGLSSTVPKPKV